MTVWEPPIREYDFLFNEVFNAIESIEGLGFEDFDADYLAMLTEAWGCMPRRSGYQLMRWVTRRA